VRQGGGQQAGGVGDRVGVVEADVELVKAEGGVDAGIEKVPFLAGEHGRQTPAFSQLRGPFSRSQVPTSDLNRWIQA
jgi:hypothetical protein